MRCVGRVCECEDTGVHLERPGGLPWACRARAERCSMGNPARRHTWAWSGGGGRRRSGDQEEWPAPPQEVVLPGFRVLPNGVAPAASALTPEPGRVRQGSPLGHSAQSPLWAAPPPLPHLRAAVRTRTLGLGARGTSPQQAPDTRGLATLTAVLSTTKVPPTGNSPGAVPGVSMLLLWLACSQPPLPLCFLEK